MKQIPVLYSESQLRRFEMAGIFIDKDGAVLVSETTKLELALELGPKVRGVEVSRIRNIRDLVVVLGDTVYLDAIQLVEEASLISDSERARVERSLINAYRLNNDVVKKVGQK